MPSKKSQRAPARARLGGRRWVVVVPTALAGVALVWLGVAWRAPRVTETVRRHVRVALGGHVEEPAPSEVDPLGPAGEDPGADAGGDGDVDAPALPARLASYNVILITVDTLRADLGFAGYPRPVSPNLDALAARSTVYDQAYSLASYTSKSMGSMLIGRYGDETLRDFNHYTTFYPANVFLAERAAGLGARTFAGMCHYYFKWPTGFAQGFDVFDTSAIPPEMSDNDTSVTSDRLSDLALAMLARPENVTPSWADLDAGGLDAAPAGAAQPDGLAGAPGPSSSVDAESALAAGRGPVPRRFFAWFHYFDPHARYVHHEGAPDFAAMDAGVPSLRDLYDDEVWFTDRQIGRVLDYVASQPWGKETAIVVTADHGEAFGEHGFYKHGRELWEPLVRVPLIVYVPGLPPRRVSAKRSAIDVTPTIVDLLGGDPASDASLRGTSLVADTLASDDASIEERDVYIDMPEGPYNEQRRALVYGDSPGMKLISFADERYELYDLAADPGEAHDLSRDREKIGEGLTRLRALRHTLEERPAN